MLVIAISLFALTGLIAAMRWHSSTTLLANREDVSLKRLQTLSKTDVPSSLFEEVFRAIGQELHIPPGQLRASDKLDELFKIDSWYLGGAQDALEDLIRAKTGNRPPTLVTVQDLLNWLADEQLKQTPRDADDPRMSTETYSRQ
jgi:hypothetical protein